jgi:hypothetical protein
MVAEFGKLSKSGLGIGGNGCFGAAISKPLMAEIAPGVAGDKRYSRYRPVAVGRERQV